jgi:hypothetical protein
MKLIESCQTRSAVAASWFTHHASARRPSHFRRAILAAVIDDDDLREESAGNLRQYTTDGLGFVQGRNQKCGSSWYSCRSHVTQSDTMLCYVKAPVCRYSPSYTSPGSAGCQNINSS